MCFLATNLRRPRSCCPDGAINFPTPDAPLWAALVPVLLCIGSGGTGGGVGGVGGRGGGVDGEVQSFIYSSKDGTDCAVFANFGVRRKDSLGVSYKPETGGGDGGGTAGKGGIRRGRGGGGGTRRGAGASVWGRRGRGRLVGSVPTSDSGKTSKMRCTTPLVAVMLRVLSGTPLAETVPVRGEGGENTEEGVEEEKEQSENKRRLRGKPCRERLQ